MRVFPALLLAACGGDEPLPGDLGDCPEDSSIAWADAEPVFATHCTRCHSTELEGEARSGAPELVNYDTIEGASNNDFLTWSMIWSEAMPKDDAPMPEDDARVVWEWLSCGGPP